MAQYKIDDGYLMYKDGWNVTGTGYRMTSSVAIEKEGCRRSLDNFLQTGVEVATMATDRHSGIWEIMREKYRDVNHQFDMYGI